MANKNKKKKTRHKPVIQLKPVSGTLIGAYIFLLCVSGAWFGDMVSNHMLVKALFAECGAVLILCWWWYNNLGITSFAVRFDWPRLLAIALFLLGSSSIFWAVNIDFYVFKWLMWLAAAGFFVLALNIVDNQKTLYRLAWYLVAGGVGIAVIGILQHLTAFDVPKSAASPASTFGNRNMASHVIVMTLPFTFYLMSQKKTRDFLCWCAAFAASFMLIYIFYTTTRAAWVSIFSSVVFGVILFALYQAHLKQAFFWNPQKRTATLVALVFTFLMCNVGPDGYKPFFSTLGKEVASIGEYASDPGTRRYEIWRGALKIGAQQPLAGTGLGSYFHVKNVGLNNAGKTLESIQTVGIQRAHNDFLELFVELGTLGIVLLVMFGLAVLWRLFTILKTSSDELAIFYLCAGSAIAGSMVNAQFSFPYQVAVPLVLFGLYSGMIIKHADQQSQPLAVKTINKGWMTSVLGALLVCLTLFVLLVNLQWFQNYKNINQRVVVEARSIDQRRANREDVGWETPIIFDGWFYHPEYQTLLKDTAKAYFAIKKHPANLNVLRSIYDYWPDEYEVNSAMARSYTEMRKFDEAQAYLPKMHAMAPAGDYTTDILAMVLANAKNDRTKIQTIYSRLVNEPEELLLSHPITLERMHTTAAELEQVEDVHRWYRLYTSKYPINAVMEANEAVVYLSEGDNKQAALPHMKNSIRLNPANPNNKQFQKYIDELE